MLTIEILAFEEIHARPGVWKPKRHRALLEAIDFDDLDSLAESELGEMAAMALQDLGLRKASDRVLDFVFEGTLSSGVRQNLVDDLTITRAWELDPNLGRQARLFDAIGLLEKAFGSEFSIPDAARVQARLVAAGREGSERLRTGFGPTFVLRALADAMPVDSVLRRLFAEALEKGPFPEAEAILWDLRIIDDARAAEPAACEFEVYSSLQWLGALEDAIGAHASDAIPETERDA